MTTKSEAKCERLRRIEQYVKGRLSANKRLVKANRYPQATIDCMEVQDSTLRPILAMLDDDPEKREPWLRS